MSVIEIQIASPQTRRHPRLFAVTVRCLLQALVMVNRMTLRSDPSIPPLYQSGCRYIREPMGTETFRDITWIREQKGGDCAHLAAWRAAELQELGENANVCITWQITRRGRRIFHVMVRRANGKIEDPSKLLGMNGKA